MNLLTNSVVNGGLRDAQSKGQEFGYSGLIMNSSS